MAMAEHRAKCGVRLTRVPWQPRPSAGRAAQPGGRWKLAPAVGCLHCLHLPLPTRCGPFSTGFVLRRLTSSLCPRLLVGVVGRVGGWRAGLRWGGDLPAAGQAAVQPLCSPLSPVWWWSQGHSSCRFSWRFPPCPLKTLPGPCSSLLFPPPAPTTPLEIRQSSVSDPYLLVGLPLFSLFLLGAATCFCLEELSCPLAPRSRMSRSIRAPPPLPDLWAQHGPVVATGMRVPLRAVSAATGGGGEKLVAFKSQNISSAKGQIVNIHNILGFAAHRTSCLMAFFVCCPTALEKSKTTPSLPCVELGAYKNRPPGQ